MYVQASVVLEGDGNTERLMIRNLAERPERRRGCCSEHLLIAPSVS